MYNWFWACGPGIFFGIFILFFLTVVILTITGMWKVFQKASQPGWASIVPIYNTIVMLQIIKKPLWWIVLFFIPFVSLIVSFIVMHYTAKIFGKGIGFTFGLIFLPFIFYPILGFGDAVYNPSVEPQQPV